MKKLLSFLSLLLFLVLLSPRAGAQISSAYAHYDSITYQAYLNADWKSVRLHGEEALRQGIDYYYLRMRLGEAWFQEGNYRKALSHYYKAQQFNSSDDFLKEMMYYCLLNLGDRDGAYRTSSGFSHELSQKLFPGGQNRFDQVGFEGGFSSDPGLSFTTGLLAGTDSLYGEQEVQKNLLYLHTGARFKVSPSVTIYAGLTGLDLKKEKQFEYYTGALRRDSMVITPYSRDYYYSYRRLRQDTVMQLSLKQRGLYLNATILPGNGWKIIPAIHLPGTTASLIRPVFRQETRSDTAYYLFSDNSWHSFDYVADYYSFFRKDTSFRNLVLAVDVFRELGCFTIGGSASFSDFNAQHQYQAGGSLYWFPFGNKDLFGSLTATALFNEEGSRMVFEPSAGGKIFRNTWLTGFVTLGNLDLFNEKNAYIFYNQPDVITFRSGADLLYSFGKHLEISLMYRLQQKEVTTYRVNYQLESSYWGATEVNSENTGYTNHSIFGGIKWNF